MSRLSCTVAIIAVAFLCVVVAQERYDDSFDHIDIKALLENDVEREKQYKCTMDEGPCETDAQKFFKRMYIFTYIHFVYIFIYKYFNQIFNFF